MRRFMRNGARFFIVTAGIIMLTSFTIDATDTFRTSNTALSLLAKNATTPTCPEGMVEITSGGKTLCVDQYENSVGDECPVSAPGAALETKTNLDTPSCQAVSAPEQTPWTYVSYHHATALCAKKGMRLPTAAEWYDAMLGTPDTEACNVSGAIGLTGSFSACRSYQGVSDGVGNAWEWVYADFSDGTFNNRTLPESGYVTNIDAAGVAVDTSAQGEELYNDDYFWGSSLENRAMMRGGFYGSGLDAGIYAVHTDVETTFAGVATGFRCIMTL